MTLSRTYLQIGKFLVTGGIGISVNLGAYEVLLRLGVNYLVGSVLALAASTVVGFVLQKFWTFNERAGHAHKQFALYAGVALCNLALNALIVYLIAGVIGFSPLIAQFIGAGVIAIASFFIYRHFIFAAPPLPPEFQ